MALITDLLDRASWAVRSPADFLVQNAQVVIGPENQGYHDK